RAFPVAPGHPAHRRGWAKQPAAVLRGTKERGEASCRVHARKAQPVDRSVPSDERAGAQITDQRVVFDFHWLLLRLPAAVWPVGSPSAFCDAMAEAGRALALPCAHTTSPGYVGPCLGRDR